MHQGFSKFFVYAVIAKFVGIGKGGFWTLFDTDVLQFAGMGIQSDINITVDCSS